MTAHGLIKKVVDDIEEARKQWPGLPALRGKPITIDDFVGAQATVVRALKFMR